MLNDISRTPTFERDWKRLKRKHYDPAKLRKALQTLMAEDATHCSANTATMR